ncbi:MAG: alpha-amylase family protein, partial [bacterium]
HPGIPHWIYEQNPDLERTGFGFLEYTIPHPAVNGFYEKFLRLLIPEVAEHPALLSYCLLNEPIYTDGTETSRKMFQAYLKRKYGTIVVVNALLRERYETFNEIPVPDVSKTSHENRAYWYEWCTFNSERLLDFHRWMKAIIREYDIATPIHTKIQGQLFAGQRFSAWGLDHDAFANLDSISGNDAFNHYVAEGRYSQKWVAQNIYYAFQRSVAPFSPIFNSENHLAGDVGIQSIPGKHMRTALWLGAMEGQGATTLWFWSYSTDAYDGAAFRSRANCVEALGRTTYDLNRLGYFVGEFLKQPAEVAILFENASVIMNQPYLDECEKAFEGTYLLDMPIRFVTDRQIMEGKLFDYKVIIAPRNTYVLQSTYEGLLDYLDVGGHLLVVGDAFAHDQHGHPRRVHELFGSPQLPQEAMTRSVGQGEVYYYPDTLSSDQYAEIIDRLSDDLGIQRAFRIRDAQGGRVPDVFARGVRVRGRFVVTAVNLGREAKRVRIQIGKKTPRWFDLVANRPAEKVILLEPLEPRMLRQL